MAKLKFFHSCMFGGKTAQLINAYEIYKRKGMCPVIIKPCIDNRDGDQKGWGVTKSRLMPNKEVPAYYFESVKEEVWKLDYGAILIDEAQFLTEDDVKFLSLIVDKQKINVIAYGLKNDSNGHLFEGSKALLAYADEVVELESLCQNPHCENKASMHLRYINGKLDTSNDSVAIEKDEVTYKSVCRPCWRAERNER